MNLKDQVIVVTGGANGIGRALCERFAHEAPKGIVVADVDEQQAKTVAEKIGGLPVVCDVSNEQDIKRLVAQTEDTYGPIDLFCANAGINIQGGLSLDDDQWSRIIDVNLMAHVYSARAVIPGMLERGSGYLLHTASAAGLLTEISSAAYAVTKHAAVAFAEWLSVTYGDRGIRVSCLCPQGVWTDMIAGDDPVAKMLQATALEPATLADVVVQSLEAEEFLILPHPEVRKYFRHKSTDYDRWLAGMRRLRANIVDAPA
ncbi:MAG: SDR family NAD(P)-dependent oxidoreductase [Planctomycetes bacterium]|nr:SDR family NAD(P)-dependent oxidoreductase [Planctomycetota bacterium]